MAAPFNNVRSKHARAITAWIISQGAGTAADTSPVFSASSNVYPVTTVRPTRGNPDPPLTGNYRIVTHVSIKGSAAKLTGQANPNAGRIAFDARVAKVGDCLMQSDDDQTLRFTAAGITAAGRALAVSDPTNNADMAEYTCLEWDDGGFGDGAADEDGCAWEEILIFNAYVCGSAIN